MNDGTIGKSENVVEMLTREAWSGPLPSPDTTFKIADADKDLVVFAGCRFETVLNYRRVLVAACRDGHVCADCGEVAKLAITEVGGKQWPYCGVCDVGG